MYRMCYKIFLNKKYDKMMRSRVRPSPNGKMTRSWYKCWFMLVLDVRFCVGGALEQGYKTKKIKIRPWKLTN